MSEAADRRIANMEGDAKLPRKNGELVFEAPWEGRAFGVAVAMNENGLYEWREFRYSLAEQIALAEQNPTPPSYYERWLTSLEKLITAKGLVTPEELDARTEEYASGDRDDDE